MMRREIKAQKNEERLKEVQEKIEHLKQQLLPMEQAYGERMEHIIRRRKLLKKMEELKIKLANAERDRNSALAYDLKRFAIPETEKELRKLEGFSEKICILPENIAQMVAKITRIPVKRLTLSENERLLKMERRLNAHVIGQESAVSAITDAIIRSKAGFSREDRPIGSFLFLGPTGVGKTQLAKALALEMFDDEKTLVRLDMSEFLEEHSISRLIGAPPGYVGYEKGGYLTEKIRNRPYSILLVDEIEKAHKRVVNLFLQILDEGRLTDSQGRTVDFTNTIILMTSNLGSEQILSKSFSKDDVLLSLKRFFPPEFINRLDGIEIFNSLGIEQLMGIIQIYIRDINARIKRKHFTITLTDGAMQYIADNAYTPEYGARPMQRYIERTITTDLSKIFLTLPPSKEKITILVHPSEDPLSMDSVFQGSSFSYYIANQE